MGYEIGKKVWVMGFYRDMGYPCKPSRWMPKVIGYYRLWVIREMGYDRVDCIYLQLNCLHTSYIEHRKKKKKVQTIIYTTDKIVWFIKSFAIIP